MSATLPVRPRTTAFAHLTWRIGIVAASYNERYTDALVENAKNELFQIDPKTQVSIFRAPGSFEIPLLVKTLAAKNHFEAIIAFGVIIKGATAHADLIAGSITHSLQSISLEHEIPVIHEVLLVADEAQAEERCLGKEINRGIEAARIALQAIRSLQDARASK